MNRCLAPKEKYDYYVFMENETQLSNTQELRQQIDMLEEKIRQAEMAAQQKLEEAAPLRSIYKWKAPERIYSPKGRPWYVTIGLVTVIVVAYAALTGNYLLILALIMLLMLLYALNSFPPKMLEHEITNKGINTIGQLYTWDKFLNFWVSQRDNQYLLNFTLTEGNVSKIILLIGRGDLKLIIREIAKYVDYLNPGGTKQNFINRYLEGNHIPLPQFYDMLESEQSSEATTQAQTSPTPQS